MDFSRIYAIGLRMGLTYKEVQHLRYGKWYDLFEDFKTLYNFEIKKNIYKTSDDYQIASLDAL